ncbi:amino acid adenylation domain-containing protein, partial [Viridibacillus arvi]
MKITKENIEDILDLTGLQQGMLYHYINDTTSSLYQEQMSITLEGVIVTDLIIAAWNNVVNTNEMLRTVFKWEKVNKPIQIVLKEYNIPFEIIDLSSELDVDAQFNRIFRTKQKENINIQEESIRIIICKINESTVNIIIKNHHILYDGWSNGIILKEFIKTYNSYLIEETPENVAKNKFKNYIKSIRTKNKNDSEKYWRGYLENIECNLATTDEDNVREFKHYSHKFSSKTEELLEKYGKCKKVSKATILYTVWGILQGKYTRENDVVFGTPVSGRTEKVQGINEMVGLFINTLPLRMKLSGNLKINELIQKVDEDINRRLEYENTPLIDIKKYSNISRNEMLFDTLVVIENYPLDKFIYGDNLAKVTNYRIEESTNFNLTIELNTFKNLEMNIMYDSNTFDSNYIDNMANHYENLMNHVLEDSKTFLNEFEIVTENERQQLLIEFNDTQLEFHNDKTIHQLFEEQVEKTPNHTAVVYDSEKMTYLELNERANALASTLRQKGIAQDHIVGIMLERSLEMIIGIIGILKAGGAYVPIDPKYPEDRINFILQDSNAKLLLTQKDLVNKTCEVINLKDESIYSKSICNKSYGKNDGLAYLIYTSGSTGNPKGIKINHRSVINTLTALQNYYPMDADGAYLQKTNYMFDVSVSEIFGWFMGGGSLLILNNGKEKDVNYVFEVIKNYGVTHINFTSSMFNLFLNELDVGNFSKIASLKYILTAGEALKINAENKDKVKELLLNKKIENLYGPTEATIYSTRYSLKNNPNETSIGKPISNTEIFILDTENKLVPIGVVGELCISGDGLAAGYLNNEKLTNEKFIENPYKSGERLYKTGDLARWLPDGNIDFLGRIDYQVKIRGFRIELEEVEGSLSSIEGIKQAIVVDKGEEGKKYLCSYYISEKEYSTGYFRDELKNSLPDYMIPSYFIKMEKIPLTPNGKIDRKSLPTPDGNISTGVEYEAPKTEMEKMLIEVWSKVLGVTNIGINDDFFNLGGDSIKAIQVSARVKNSGYFITLKDIFKNTTIKEMSKIVKENNNIIDQGLVEGEVQLTPIQKMFFEEKGYDKNHCNQAVMLFKKDGFEESIIRKVFEAIVIHHDALRMEYKIVEDEIKQLNRGVHGSLFNLDVFDLSDENRTDYNNITDQCTKIQESMDINGGPLVKLGLFKTVEGDHLLIAIHHLVIDSVSWRIIFEDFGTAYNNILLGENVELPDKTTSFKEWASKQKEYGNSYNLKLEENYWLELGDVNIKELPKDNKVLQRLRKNSVSLTTSLEKDATEKLLKDVNKVYNTEINDILLTALAETISRWSGTDKILVNLESHGREEIIGEADITRTIGWFTSVHPVLLEVNSNDISYDIKNIKDSLRRIPNKGVGYGILKYLRNDRNENILSLNQKVEICFNYLGQFDEDLNDGIFELSDMNSGEVVSVERHSPYPLDISGIIERKKLSLTITYDKDEYNEETISNILNEYKVNLLNIINHCVIKEKSEITAADITKQNITLDELEPYNNEIHNIEGIYPLTPMQEGMLFHSLFDENSTAYHEVVEIELNGELNTTAFEESFNNLIKNHAILRTSFDHKNFNKSMQVTYKKKKAKVITVDVSAGSIDKREYIENLKNEDLERGYNLTDDTLIRMIMVKTSENSYSLIISYHHIIIDGWSLSILIRELFNGYKAVEYGEKVRLINEKPYSEYIDWLFAQDKRKAEKHWQEYLLDLTDVSEVPYSQNYELKEYKNKAINLTISENLTQKIEDVARRNKVTVNSIMQSIWGLLLQKYNNSSDIVFGYVVSGRSPEINDVENMVGLFINTIPLRMKTEKNSRYRDVIKKINSDLIENENYSYYSLSDIQHSTGLEKQLYNNIMIFENYPIDEVGITNNIEVVRVNVEEQTNYNFNITITQKEVMDIMFSFNEYVYSAESVTKIKENFETVLNKVVENEDILISDIEIVSENERNKLLVEFNDTHVDYPRDKAIHQLFEEQVEKNPNNIAVVFKGEELTYIQLNEEANQLAFQLREKYDVKKGEVVAIHVDRNIEMIIGIIASLKVNAVCLPIETKYPIGRVSEMLIDSNAKVVIKNGKNGYRGFKGIEFEFVRNKNTSIDFAKNLTSMIEQNDLAYLIYTSGSTGKPKAVEINHKGIINHAFAKIKETNLTQSDVCCHNLSFNFVASIWQIFSPLFVGSKLYLYEDDIIADALNLFKHIENDKVSVLEVVPSLINSFLELEDKKRYDITLENLKKVLLTGERVGAALVNKFYSKYNAKLINAYGQSEFSDDTLHYHIPNTINTQKVLIGKPANNTRVYILDQSGKIVP